MMHEYLVTRGIRSACEITLILPLEAPTPPSPETSRALLAAFAERNITFVADREMRLVDTQRREVTLDDGRVFPYDLFLGVPAIRGIGHSSSNLWAEKRGQSIQIAILSQADRRSAGHRSDSANRNLAIRIA